MPLIVNDAWCTPDAGMAVVQSGVRKVPAPDGLPRAMEVYPGGFSTCSWSRDLGGVAISWPIRCRRSYRTDMSPRNSIRQGATAGGLHNSQ